MRYLKLTGTPFDDSKAKYENHKYRVELEYAKEVLGASFFGKMTNAMIESTIDETRDNVYLYIQSESGIHNYDVIEYRIAKEVDKNGDYQLRDIMIDAQIKQLRYTVRSGGDMLSDMHGVNTKTGTAIQDFKKLRRDFRVSENVEALLKSGRYPIVMRGELCFKVDPDDYRSDY